MHSYFEDIKSEKKLVLYFTFRLTSAKRKILEDIELYYNEENGMMVELSKAEQRMRRKKACEKLILVPGKLDHASVVAYNVGHYDITEEEESVSVLNSNEEKMCAVPEITKSLSEINVEEDEINKNVKNEEKRLSIYENQEVTKDGGGETFF